MRRCVTGIRGPVLIRYLPFVSKNYNCAHPCSVITSLSTLWPQAARGYMYMYTCVLATPSIKPEYASILHPFLPPSLFPSLPPSLQILTFVGIGLGVLLLGYIQITLYQIADERQVHKIRLLFYRAVLRQNIGWFDSNPSGELASRLSE